MLARTPRPALDRRIDAVQCKPNSVQNKTRRPHESARQVVPADSRGARIAGTHDMFSPTLLAGQAKFAGLWDCPVATGGLIKNNINTDWDSHV
jgi:hypothetical protein